MGPHAVSVHAACIFFSRNCVYQSNRSYGYEDFDCFYSIPYFVRWETALAETVLAEKQAKHRKKSV